MHAYIGSYAPNGLGLYHFAQDPVGGGLQPLGVSAGPRNPSWLCANGAGTRLYVANEHEDAEGGSGEISAYAREPGSGALTLINSQPSGGGRPVHISLSADERHLFVANYGGGSVGVLALAADGGLGSLLSLSRHAELFGDVQLGPQPAALACPGSFAISDHDGPHAHMAQLDPTGRHLLVSDLGLDLIISWRFDARSGGLSAPQALAASPGAGPRHFVFHPQRADASCYVLNEEASTLAWLHFDGATGRLTPRAEVSCLPAGFQGTSFASDLRCSADGRFLYCLNRLHDSVAIFALAADGAPRLLTHEWTRGSYPRSFALDPSGRYMYVCNQRSDHVAIFSVGTDGGLSFSGQYVAVGSPVAICLLP